jgi:hypothetical protein
MKEVTIKGDGTFQAMFDMKGTWKLKDGKLLVSWANNPRKDEPAVMEGEWLKFPAPAMGGKFCYLKRK